MSYIDSITNTEKAIALEECYRNQMGKFFVPILTPTLEHDKAYKTKVNPSAASNIVSGNASKLELQPYYVANYIELKCPFKVFKNTEVVINLLNGTNGIYDVSNINVVGEYDEYDSKKQSEPKTYSKRVY